MAQDLSQDSGDAEHGILRKHAGGQDVDSSTAATSAGDFIGPRTVRRGQGKVLAGSVDKAVISDSY